MLGQFLTTVAFLSLLLLPRPAAAQERPKLYLGASTKTLGYSPLWVGSKRGFAEQTGAKAAPPDARKFVELSYLTEALA